MIPLCRACPCKADLLVSFHIRSRQIQSINKLLDTVVAFRGLRRLCVSCRHDFRLFLNVFSFLFDHYKNSSINSPGVIISGLSISISEKSLSPVSKISALAWILPGNIWIFPALGWGIGIAVHAVNTFFETDPDSRH